MSTLADEGATCPNRVEHFMQCCRVSPDVFEAVTFLHLFPKRAIFLLEVPALHRARDQQLNLVEIERLGHKS